MSGTELSARRILAMVKRYLYLLRGSLPRIVDLIYWPTVQMLMWGLFTQFLVTKSSFIAQAAGLLISGVLLWDVMFRGNIGIALSFLEEMWSRNLAQLFASPLRAWEWGVALFAVAMVRTLIGMVPAALLAIPLYHFSIFDMGWWLVAFFFNLLVFGSAIGLAMSGLVLRWGLGAESLCWAGIFLIAPLSGVYYPISILPDWLQPIAWALPSSHVFEGMRAVLIDRAVRFDLLWNAVALNIVYLAIAFGLFLLIFRDARSRGTLLQMGE
jgi:ABC-2 type transport system permease protein